MLFSLKTVFLLRGPCVMFFALSAASLGRVSQLI